MLKLEKLATSFPLKLIAVIRSASTADHGIGVCFLVPMLIVPPFKK